MEDEPEPNGEKYNTSTLTTQSENNYAQNQNESRNSDYINVLYPNPLTRDQTSFRIASNVNDEVLIIMRNTTGQEIMRERYNFDGAATIEVSLPRGLDGGIYFVEMSRLSDQRQSLDVKKLVVH
jgi:hypothetical protein